MMVPVGKCLCVDPMNGRIEIDPERVSSLAQSLATIGLINPITVRLDGKEFEVLAGRHRLAAALQLNWLEILASVQVADDVRAGTIRLSENVMRSNLSAIEEAIQLHTLVEGHPAGADGVATSLGRVVGWVLDRLDLLRYPESIQRAIHFGKLSLGASKHLAQIEPEELREIRVEQAILHGISATTAAMWRQDAACNVGMEVSSEKIACVPDVRQVETVTTVLCLRCHERGPTTDAVPCHVCTGCIRELNSDANASGGE